jgi:hypothetical protein
MNRGRGQGRGRGRGARGGRGAGGGVEEAAPGGPQPNVDMAAILAEMQSMWAEMNAMHQTSAGAAVGMSLEQFAGTGAAIEVADWLSATTEKLDAFRIP